MKMNTILILSFVILFSCAESFRYKRRKGKKCEPVQADICLEKVHAGYNSTSFTNPNYFKHRSQVEAISELEIYRPLINIGCSKHLASFLCSLYIPYCDPGFPVVKPCRNLCLNSYYGCKKIMDRFSVEWSFNCTAFPDSSVTNMCLGTDVKVEKPPVKDVIEVKKVVEPVKVKARSKKGWIIGIENELLLLECPKGKVINIRKVRASSGCCPVASKMVINAMCTGNKSCKVQVSKNTLGGHCKRPVVKLAIRYKCVSAQKIKHPCPVSKSKDDE